MQVRPAVLAPLLFLISAACAQFDRNIERRNAPVTPITVGESADVSALDLARAMVQAGFTREEILAHGPAVRNSLATSGAAQITDGESVVALMSIMDGSLYLISRTRGTLVYELSSI